MVTVQQSGGDYSGLAAAIAADETTINVNGSWTVDDDLTATLTVDGGATTITCDSSSRNPGFPHTGTGSWYRLRQTSAVHVFTVTQTLTITGMDVMHEAAGASDEIFRVSAGVTLTFDSCLFGYSAIVGSGQSDILLTDASAAYTIRATNCATYNADRAVWSLDTVSGACTVEINSCSSYDCGPGGAIDRWEAYVGINAQAAHVVRIFNSALWHNGTSGALVQVSTAGGGESAVIDRSITNLADWANTWDTETISDSSLSYSWTDSSSPGAGNWVVLEDITSTIQDLRNADNAENDAQDAHADGTGAGLTMPSTDVAGTSRPQNTNYDIGHFEIVASGVTGTSAFTFPVLTQSVTGQVAHTGTSTFTFPVLTQDATGAAISTISGTSAFTFPVLTMDATGIHIVSGTSAFTFPVPTQSATGSVSGNVTGTSAMTFPVLTMEATGIFKVSGTSAFTMPVPTQTATGAVGVDVFGTAAFTFPVFTMSGTASHDGSAVDQAEQLRTGRSVETQWHYTHAYTSGRLRRRGR